MAPGVSRPRFSPCQNLSPIDPIENELTRDPGLVGGLHSSSTSSALFRNPTLGPDLVPTLILAPVPAPAPVLSSFDKLFKQFMKAYLESKQIPKQPPAERKQSLKAKVPDVYNGKSYMDCYHFCQQYKDHFETAGANEANQTSFAASFLCKSISI